MRLTAELINNSLSYLNPLKERELDLRGHRIPAIENLGVAKDHDSFDLTDNDIAVLSNFPLSARLRTLLLARNRISSIQPTLHKSIPHLTTLVLSSNRMQELADLDPLGGFRKLTHLVLMENPVCKKEVCQHRMTVAYGHWLTCSQHYRAWVLWRCPSVRFLDYKKVKQAERDEANELFGSVEAPTALASKILNIKSRFDPSAATQSSAGTSKISRVKLTDKERKRVEQLIKNAKSLQEIAQLERELNEGKIPGGIVDDAMDES